MAGVVMGAPLHLTWPHRQQGLRSVLRLELRLLIDAEHKRPLGWRQVEADYVANFLDKQRVVRELECLGAVGRSPKPRQMRWMVDGA